METTRTIVEPSSPVCDEGLSLVELWIAAGDTVFARALPYAPDITIVERSHGHAAGTSTHSRPYMVELWWGVSGVQGQCSCPHNALGNFCKHMCALGLMILFQGDSALIPSHYLDQAQTPSVSSVSEQDPLSTLTPQEESYLLGLAAQGKIPAARITDFAALKSISNPRARFHLMEGARKLFSPAYVPNRPWDFFEAVDEFITQCQALMVLGNVAFAYQLLDHAMRRFSIILGASSQAWSFRHGVTRFHKLVTAHCQSATACSSLDHLVNTLVTVRESKVSGLPLSFIPYADRLGEDGLRALELRLSIVHERVTDPRTRVRLFSSVKADDALVRARQLREFFVMRAEVAYMSKDFDAVRRWAQESREGEQVFPAHLPAQIAVALHEHRYDKIPALVKALRKNHLIKPSGARGLDDARLFTQYAIHPDWAIEVLGAAGFPKKALSLASRLFRDFPYRDTALRYKKALETYSCQPEKDYSKLITWLFQHADDLEESQVLATFVVFDDIDTLWMWDEKVGLQFLWRTFLYSPFHNRLAEPGRRVNESEFSWRPENVQRALERVGMALMAEVKAGHADWMQLATQIREMMRIAEAADSDLCVDTHVGYLRSLHKRLWAFQPSAFQSSTLDDVNARLEDTDWDDSDWNDAGQDHLGGDSTGWDDTHWLG